MADAWVEVGNIKGSDAPARPQEFVYMGASGVSKATDGSISLSATKDQLSPIGVAEVGDFIVCDRVYSSGVGAGVPGAPTRYEVTASTPGSFFNSYTLKSRGSLLTGDPRFRAATDADRGMMMVGDGLGFDAASGKVSVSVVDGGGITSQENGGVKSLKLAPASVTTLGGVTPDGESIKVDEAGVISLNYLSDEEFVSYVLPKAAPTKQLSEFTWAELASVLRDTGYTNDQLSYLVGQERVISLTSAYDGSSASMAIAVRCIGIGQDRPADSELAAHPRLMTFQCIGCIGTSRAMSSGVPSSYYDTYVNALLNDIKGNLVSLFPADLSPYVVKRLLPIKVPGASGVTATKAYAAFLPSAYEVFGSGDETTPAEGEQYQWYATNTAATNRIKYNVQTGSSANWWLRTQMSSNVFCYVSNTGSLTSGSYSASRMVAPCFCVG